MDETCGCFQAAMNNARMAVSNYYSFLAPKGPGAAMPCPEHKPDGGSRALP